MSGAMSRIKPLDITIVIAPAADENCVFGTNIENGGPKKSSAGPQGCRWLLGLRPRLDRRPNIDQAAMGVDQRSGFGSSRQIPNNDSRAGLRPNHAQRFSRAARRSGLSIRFDSRTALSPGVKTIYRAPRVMDFVTRGLFPLHAILQYLNQDGIPFPDQIADEAFLRRTMKIGAGFRIDGA